MIAKNVDEEHKLGARKLLLSQKNLFAACQLQVSKHPPLSLSLSSNTSAASVPYYLSGFGLTTKKDSAKKFYMI